MNQRMVYIVNGSEDGLLGVFGSLSRAVARAVEYAAGEGRYVYASVNTQRESRMTCASALRDVSPALRKMLASEGFALAHFYRESGGEMDASFASARVESWIVE